MANKQSLTTDEIQAVQVRLHELTKRDGSQAATARALGVSQQVISKAIAGGQIGFTLARKVADNLGLTFDQLVGRSPGPATEDAPRPAPRSRRDFAAMPTEDLAELVQELAMRQLQDVIDRHPQLGPHSVELATAAHVLAGRRQKEAPRRREDDES